MPTFFQTSQQKFTLMSSSQGVGVVAQFTPCKNFMIQLLETKT